MTDHRSPPADQVARRRALDIDTSFTVVAPAGSGKTGLLTQRLLALLAVTDAPEQILCMTFTRKAAGEMRRRVLEALTHALDDSPPGDAYEHETWTLARRALAQSRTRNWQLIEAPNRLRIQTIDSFCRDLARQLALQSGFGELPEPTEDAASHYRAAVRELLAELDAAATDSTTADALETLLAHLDNDMPRLETMLMRLLASREQWLPHVLASRDAQTLLEGYLEHLHRETLATATQLLAPVASDLALLADYAASNLLAAHPSAPDLSADEHGKAAHPLLTCQGLVGLPEADATAPERARQQWLGLLDLLLTKTGEWRKTINVKLGFPAAKGASDSARATACKQLWEETLAACRHQNGLLAALNDLRALPAARYDDAQWQVLAALTTLLPRLVARLQLVFRAERSCDFNEITLAALAALGDDDNPTDLVLSLDARIQHILVDECQDTSSVQFALLRRLTTGWQPGDGRTLFLVGDGMQSLYGFRNANVGLFLDARHHPVGGAVPQSLDLSANFRSQAGVVGWVNRLFTDAFPALADTSRGAVPYAPAQAVKPVLAGPAVTIDLFRGGEDRVAEAEVVADCVATARAENPDGSVAILVRSRAQLREILPALQRRGLRWQATDIDPLGTRMAVLDLQSLTRALLCPADRIAWLAVLRAPWCGLDLADLHAVANNTAGKLGAIDRIPDQPARGSTRCPLLLEQILHHADLYGLSAAGRQILTRIAAVLAVAWHERRRKPLRTWIEGIWIAMGGPAALVDPDALTDCRQYLDLLERHVDSTPSGCGIDDWPAFVAAVGRLYAAPAADADPGLQIMTIHKAKGLEFDTVILPGLHRQGRNNDAELLLWAERVSAAGDAELLIAAPHKLGAEDDPLYSYLKREGTLKARLESTRVLYVACTRAVRRLHLLFQEPAKNSPSKNSLLASLWPALADELAAPPNDMIVRMHQNPVTAAAESAAKVAGTDADSDAIDKQPLPTHSLRLPASWQCPVLAMPRPTEGTLPFARSLTDLRGDRDADGDVHHDARQQDSRHIGTVLHRALRQVVSETLARWDSARIARQKPAWIIQLQELGIADVESAVTRIEAALVRCLSHPDGRWLLNHEHADSACELALCYFTNGIAFTNGVANAVVDDGRQHTAIIDRTFVAAGTRWIIDYKSATPSADEAQATFLVRQRNQYRQQLESYARLFTGAGQLPVQLALYYPLLPHLDILQLGIDEASP